MSTAAPTPTRRPLLISLIAVGALLLVAVIVIVSLVIGQNTSRPASNVQPLDTPSSTAQPDDSTAIDPATGTGTASGSSSSGGQQSTDTSTRFTSFSADLTVECDPTGEAEKPSPSISWASANATAAYFTPSNRDAVSDSGYKIPLSGNQNDMSAAKGAGERFEFPCNHRQTMDVTITLVAPGGQHVSKSVTFTDVNWNTGGGDDD